MSGAGDGGFAIAVKEAGAAGGGDDEGEVDVFAEECGREVDVGHVDEGVGDEVVALEGGVVAVFSDFVFGGAVGEVEDDAGEASFGDGAEVVDVVGAGEASVGGAREGK